MKRARTCQTNALAWAGVRKRQVCVPGGIVGGTATHLPCIPWGSLGALGRAV